MTHLTEADAVNAAMKALNESGDYTEFEGQNCNDYNDEANCAGWDGESPRCDCGNRRVFWDVEGNVTDGYIATARAY